MDLIEHGMDAYSQFWRFRDLRADRWWMMNSMKPTLVLLALYFIIIKYGSMWMAKRQPFELRWAVFVYNVFIAILNLHIFKELAIVSYRQGYSWLCEPVRVSTDPEEIRILVALEWYLMSKIFEFLDTVFIVFRKKSRQLTFLHVYHHSSMLFLCWVIGRWVPGGNAALAALVNAFVHVVMYSYYSLSALGPRMAKYLWWKRYLTIVQLIQFMIGFVLGIGMFVGGCDFPNWFKYLAVLYTFSYLVLFGRFYVSAYVIKNIEAKMMSKRNVDQEMGTQLWSSSDVRYRKVNSTQDN